MAKLWTGVTDGTVNRAAEDFNASIRFDQRLYLEDITGSMAHVSMLGAQGMLGEQEVAVLLGGLQQILDGLQQGTMHVDPTCEDIHTFVEQTLVSLVGDVGKKLHTARSRNDQVALDLKLYVRSHIDVIRGLLRDVVLALCAKAEQYKGTIMCGYTHLQRAQPITFGHHLMAYVWMFLRDSDRLVDCRRRLNQCPIGSCALAGTGHPIDRVFEAAQLGFDAPTPNSLDGVSDRDYACELLSDLALVAVHLSRLSEEIVLWNSWEFGYIHLDDAFTTGSSIMPQKKNPDIAELCRGKSGRVFGDLMALLTVLKGLPLAYNKDMQEDKESVFDAIDTIEACLGVFAPMIGAIRADEQAMLRAVGTGFLNATDAADYLVAKGLPFRDAYRIVGQMVALCIRTQRTLEQLPLAEMQVFSPLFEGDVYPQIAPQACVNKRTSLGGTAIGEVEKQIRLAKELCK